jgi:hypothetical protein
VAGVATAAAELVEIDLLRGILPVMSSQAQQVALVDEDVNGFLLFEKPGDTRITFIEFPACFNRDGKEPHAGKSELTMIWAMVSAAQYKAMISTDSSLARSKVSCNSAP